MSSRSSSPGRAAFGSSSFGGASRSTSGGSTPRSSSNQRSRPTSARPSTNRPASAAATAPAERSATKRSVLSSAKEDTKADGRVRVAVRLRPMLEAEIKVVGDAPPTIEIEPEVKRVLVKRDHWDSDSYQFDMAFPGTTSQRRVFEEFCQPVVESCMKGYNGTVMAYGQTGTGKTHTLGNLGLTDPSQRGIVVRSLDHILTTAEADQQGKYEVSLSYLQLYMETVLDLLQPEKEGLNITEDPSTGEVLCSGAKVVAISSTADLINILSVGEQNRVVANQKLNATSSRSHSVLLVTIRRLPADTSSLGLTQSVTATRGKLLLVDLAGSERISKSGSEGQMLEEAKFINLSLTALGKCINALSDSTPGHIPYRDSKLTRILKDSFGGSAKTSLIITVSPLKTHLSETASTLAFGQRAIKIENNTKIREEVDLKLLNRRLQAELDNLNVSYERQSTQIMEGEAKLAQVSATIEGIEKQKAGVEKQLLADREAAQRTLDDLRKESASAVAKVRAELEGVISQEKQAFQQELEKKNQEIQQLRTGANEELQRQSSTASKQIQVLQESNVELKAQLAAKEASLFELQKHVQSQGDEKGAAIADARKEMSHLMEKLAQQHKQHEEEMERQRVVLQAAEGANKNLKEENQRLMGQLEAAVSANDPASPAEGPDPGAKGKKKFWKFPGSGSRSSAKMNGQEGFPAVGSTPPPEGSSTPDSASGSRGTWTQHRDAVSAVSKLFEHVGLTTVFGLLKYDDRDVRLHAVKVIANLAAEEENQVNIVQEGGLEALFDLLQTCTDEMTLRVAAGAVANLAMSEQNQHRIVEEGGLELLVKLSTSAVDSQTQRMIAGAIANLCGNSTILDRLQASGSLQVLVNLTNSEQVDVLSQVARGFANNSKCTKGKTHLVELGALPAILNLASKTTVPTVRKHAMLALCQIASCEVNVQAIKSSGALNILTEIANSEWDEFKSMAATVLANPLYARSL